MIYTFRVFRFDPATDEAPRFEEYDLEVTGAISVLEALIEIRDTQDASLAFRYSCRGAVCGSCGMVINGGADLACRVQVQGLPSRQVTVEPLANLEIIRDLVVDMEPFWKGYGQVQPYLHLAAEPPEKEHRVSDAESEKVGAFCDCVLCACCYSACPAVSDDEEYVGPAALAKLYRFVADPRDERRYATLEVVDDQRGAWGCRTVFRCVDACPKGVRPVDGIEGVRRALVKERLKAAVRRK